MAGADGVAAAGTGARADRDDPALKRMRFRSLFSFMISLSPSVLRGRDRKLIKNGGN